MSVLDAALAYAKRGWRVFPVHGIRADNGLCTCGWDECSDPGKHPVARLAPHGLLDASSDLDQVEAWFAGAPYASVAIRTGIESGLVVIDIDPRHGGGESIVAIQSAMGFLPATADVETGGAGIHHYYTHPGGGIEIASRSDAFGKEYPGVDVRGDGGYVVASPSGHVSGGTYRWDDVRGFDFPLAELPKWVAQKLLHMQSARSESSLSQVGEIVSAGGRNQYLTRIAGVQRRAGQTADEIYANLMQINQSRIDPQLGEREVRRIADSVARYPGSGPSVAGGVSTSLRDMSEWLDTEDDPTQWLVEGLCMMGGLTILSSSPKAGKSHLARNLIRSVVLGEGDWLGRPVRPGRAAYLALEEHEPEVKAHFRRMGFTAENVGDRCYLRFGLGPEDGVKWLAEIIGEYAPDLIVFDPAQNLLRLKNLNDYTEVQEKMTNLVQLARETNTSMLMLHHDNKLAQMDLTNIGANLMGSQAFFGATDSLLCMASFGGVRMIASRNRYGTELEPRVLILDKKTGLITLGGTSVEERKAEIAAEGLVDHLERGKDYSVRDLELVSGLTGDVLAIARESLIRGGKLRCIGLRPPYRYALPSSIEDMAELAALGAEEQGGLLL